MMKFHVHVYEVIRKAEVNLDAYSEEEARADALKIATSGRVPFMESDCRFVALSFPVGDES